MKKENNIRSTLGLSQEEIAMLLKVSRSQWSMYEIGKRDLPIEAKILLAKLLQAMQETTIQNKSTQPLAEKHLHDSKKLLTELTAKNQYQQKLLGLKIEKIEQKYTTNLSVLELVHHLENQEQTIYHRELLKKIKTKAEKRIDKHGLHVQTHHQLKKALLLEEEKLLKKFLKKLP